MKKHEGDSLQLASEIGLICKRSRKNLDGSVVFSFDFYHQLILEYFAAFQFNQILEAMAKSESTAGMVFPLSIVW